jgi:hypothetical protein
VRLHRNQSSKLYFTAEAQVVRKNPQDLIRVVY